jgi:hypothetical protein
LIWGQQILDVKDLLEERYGFNELNWYYLTSSNSPTNANNKFGSTYGVLRLIGAVGWWHSFTIRLPSLG